MEKNNLPQHNEDMQDLSEEQLDQVAGGRAVYVVKSGDSLADIASRVYGTSTEWQRIYKKNKAVIGNNPDLIRPGQRLKL